MVKAPRENRVPIMMSDDELTAIDDWRFDNRVATRSDAVRRLVRIGLAATAQADAINDAAEKLFDALLSVSRKRAENPNIQPKELVGLFLESRRESLKQSVRLSEALRSFLGEANIMQSDGSMEELIAHSDALREAIAGSPEKYVKILRSDFPELSELWDMMFAIKDDR